MKVKCYQVSSTGVVRDHNEDFIAFWEPADFDLRQQLGSIAILADGVGGQGHGEVASRLAAEAALAVFKEAKPETTPANLIRQIFNEASTKVFHAGQEQGRMATTLLVSLFRQDGATIAHVGDSRAYLFRAHALQQLTSDHSLVAEQVRHGLMSHQQAATSELQSLLTRALGTEENVTVDADEIELFLGDSLLLCSDGLTRMVPENEIASILTQIPSVRIAAERLVSRANEHGGQDNITVIVIRMNKPRSWFAKFIPWCSSNLV